MRKNYLRMLCLIMIVALAGMFTACKTEDITKRAENEEKLFKALTEYPGEGLYDPEVTVIGLDAPEPTEEELAEAEEKAAKEEQAWRDAVGGCFADGMFDTFYTAWDHRLHVLSMAKMIGLKTTMISFSIEDDADQSDDNIEHVLITVTSTDEKGETKSFDMDWRVFFDKDDHDLLQKIELADDGGFYDAYASDDIDITTDLTTDDGE